MVSDEEEYWVAAPNFVTQGGDGYWEFQNSKEYIDTGVVIVDAVEDFIKGVEMYNPKYEGEYLLSKKQKSSITSQEIQVFPELSIRDKVIRGI
ncbi:MAG: hypothetical protein CM1200mP12_13690 [Gammaproteobacteria bacterium]|nr:MAG: hypothetical protein CM1200mP12_13690 [Gammaproteobacteria bacterium]